jgi:hypothetical protein
MSKARLSRPLQAFGFLVLCLAASSGIGDCFTEAFAAPDADPPEPYVSKEGRFRIRLPGKPKVADQKVNTSSGPLVIHMARYDTPGGTSYGVSYFDLAPEALAGGPDAVLERSVRGMTSVKGWKLISKKAIKLGEHPGREVIGEANPPGAPEPGYGHTRAFLVENRLYQMTVLGAKSKVVPADVEKFLDSFELLQDAPAAPGSCP